MRSPDASFVAPDPDIFEQAHRLQGKRRGHEFYALIVGGFLQPVMPLIGQGDIGKALKARVLDPFAGGAVEYQRGYQRVAREGLKLHCVRAGLTGCCNMASGIIQIAVKIGSDLRDEFDFAAHATSPALLCGAFMSSSRAHKCAVSAGHPRLSSWAQTVRMKSRSACVSTEKIVFGPGPFSGKIR